MRQLACAGLVVILTMGAPFAQQTGVLVGRVMDRTNFALSDPPMTLTAPFAQLRGDIDAVVYVRIRESGNGRSATMPAYPVSHTSPS